jgi:ribosomal-protein-alanine N-acetyltransferase
MPELTIGLMVESDIDQVHAIEKACFSTPWPRESFILEITENACARYIVLHEDGHAIAYGGMWFVLDEGHITNIAVRPDRWRMGYGAMVTQAMIRLAADSGMSFLTLECRRSNVVARKMYRKLGFIDVGYRKRYYADNNEDAIVMLNEHLPEGDPENDPYLVRL